MSEKTEGLDLQKRKGRGRRKKKKYIFQYDVRQKLG